jgi:hypothetical protein
MRRRTLRIRSKSKKRITNDPSQKNKKDDQLVYLDQKALKQMKNSFKLLCEDIV